MTPAAMLALLLAAHVCARSDFATRDGSALSVIVCPVMHEAETEPAPAAPEHPPQRAPAPAPSPKPTQDAT